MLFTHLTFIGIDPTAGQRPFHYAALDDNLRLLALGQGSLEDVAAFTGGQEQAVVAINGPRQPNQGVMKQPDVRAALQPPPRPGRWSDHRLAEYLLRQRNITIPRTPDRESLCPGWMKMSFSLFRRLLRLGYALYPAEGEPLQALEVYPHAAFCALLEQAPFPKHTLEGRLQRQLVLHECQVAVANPMLFFEEITRHRLLRGILPTESLHTAEELDALVAAYTAWMTVRKPDELLLLGDRQEGQIALPVSALKSHYD
jgi:hypothetical protein